MKLNWNFLGEGGAKQKPSMVGGGGGGVWIVSGTAHSHTNSLQDTDTYPNILSAQYCHYLVEQNKPVTPR